MQSKEENIMIRDRYEAVIGVETHVQLATQTKIFCSCPNVPLAEPNTHICEVCTGHPGTLPVLNERVIDFAIMVGIATNCRINQTSEFSRKHYFYPDLPKNFQITQADFPVAEAGYLEIPVETGLKRIRIRRIHIEEDAGKSIHSSNGSISFVDLNRAGTPLLEIVTEPDLSSPDEVRAYLKSLHAIITTIGAGTGNMEEGAFRADTNVSVRLRGETKLGIRCELKNINSFKFISDAVIYEIDRQIALLESGEKITQQTRLWDTKQRVTVPMRSKEEAADYRYMPEPDLPLLTISDEWIMRIKAQLPELPTQKATRFISQYGITQYEADILVSESALANYYESAARLFNQIADKPKAHKLLSNWVLRDVLGYLKENSLELERFLVTPQHLAQLIILLDSGKITGRIAQEVFAEMATTGTSPEAIVAQKGLQQMGSQEELLAILRNIIASNPHQVSEYRAGKEKLWGFFVGEAMKATKGRANPQQLNELLKKLLSE